MPDFLSLKKLFHEDFIALDQFYQAQIQCFDPIIQPYLTYCFAAQGKRLRALLLFLAGYKGNGIVNPSLVKAAAIIEMVHYTTLIHDDILDAGQMRQGQPTLSRKAGVPVAVLTGDALFAHALVLASEFPDTRVCRIVAEATRQVCSGEIMQTLHEQADFLSFDTYIKRIELKTAELFSACLHLGALLAHQPDGFIQAVRSFGYLLGRAYQIYDDVVDYLEQETTIGKTLGTDFQSGKTTLPIIQLLAAVPDPAKLKHQIDQQSISLEAIKQLLKDYEIINSIHSYFKSILQEAQNHLIGFQHIPSTSLLMQAAEGIDALWPAQ